MSDILAVILAVCPHARSSIVDGLAAAMPELVTEFGIATPLRQAHFLAQCAHESAGFATTVEYASGAAYEGRKDLGNTQPGDGPRYKGRGLIQTTGRANYREDGKELGVDLIAQPERAADFPWAALLAGVYWSKRHINTLADRDDLDAVTRAVNGGLNGLQSRAAYLVKAKAALAGQAYQPAVAMNPPVRPSPTLVTHVASAPVVQPPPAPKLGFWASLHAMLSRKPA